jgi:phage terminase large subunit
MENINEIRIQIPEIFQELVKPHRYKSYYGGRGSGKSWAIARVLLAIAAQRKTRVLCTREFQSSIADSVYKLLVDQIHAKDKNGNNLFKYYRDGILKNTITSSIGSEFIFKGLNRNIQEIKSLEGVNICWVEEAQSTSEESWKVLVPTIRKENSEVWLSWNTGEEKDPTYQRFVVSPPPDCISQKVSYRDNPYFPAVLEKERAYHQKVDPDSYENIWEGFPLTISEACIFRNKYREATFEAPENTQFLFGADFGFSNDPSTLIRCFINDKKLYIDQEAYRVGVELNNMDVGFYDQIPESKKWPIKADNSRPETISHLKKNYGYNISAAKKWQGSVKDGITFLKGFEEIVIHSRCKHTLEEARLYSYKIDPKTQEVLPEINSKHDHCWDAIRYALDGKITNKGFSWVDFVG